MIEVTEFYKEYWNLQQLHDLCQVYQKIKDHIWSFLELYRLIKAAGMDLKHVNRLLEIANNELPKVEEAYKNLHGEVVKLNLTKQDAVTTILKLNGDIIYLRNAIEYQRLEREKQESEKRSLYLKKIRLESVIQQLQKSHEYARIVQIVKRQVSIAIGDDKQMLKLAFESIIESLLSDPFRLESLFEYATSSASTSTSPYCIEYMDHDTKPGMYGKRYLSLDHEADRTQVEYLKNIILEESEVFYNKKEALTNMAVGEVATYNNNQPSLTPNEKQSIKRLLLLGFTESK